MKAWTCRRYGGPEQLRLEERPDPVPGPGEMIVRVMAASVNSADSRIRGCRFPAGMALAGRLALGWRGPRAQVLGADCAGVVEALGPGLKGWRTGDRVVVVTGMRMGCHAERVRVTAKDVVSRLPAGMEWGDAVSLPFGGQTARHFLRKAGLKPGDEVLVIGASGAVGGAAVQRIVRAGARAIAVTRSVNADWVRALGAEEVIDHQARDYARESRRYDLVMDCVGAGTFRTLRHLAKPGGAYLAVAGGLPDFVARSSGGVRCVTGVVAESREAIDELLDEAAAGRFRPLVGARFAFEDLPAAHALVDSGRKRGAVVVDTRGKNGAGE
jgi:NADPH:quinone reductase-like Zn-dependent oxidoreductase